MPRIRMTPQAIQPLPLSPVCSTPPRESAQTNISTTKQTSSTIANMMFLLLKGQWQHLAATAPIARGITLSPKQSHPNAIPDARKLLRDRGTKDCREVVSTLRVNRNRIVCLSTGIHRRHAEAGADVVLDFRSSRTAVRVNHGDQGHVDTIDTLQPCPVADQQIRDTN